MPRPVYPIIALFLSVALQLLPGSALADSVRPHTAEYKIRISVLSGTMHTSVSHTESGYIAAAVIKPAGFARLLMDGEIGERSLFVDERSGIRPIHYASTDTLTGDGESSEFDFYWENGTVDGRIGDRAMSFELDGAVHDRVSIQYQLMRDLAAGKPTSDYSLLDGDELKELQISVVGNETINVPFGTYQAVAIRHQAKDSTRVTTLWCAEALGYLPVRIEQHRGGKLRVRALLTRYNPTTVSRDAGPASD